MKIMFGKRANEWDEIAMNGFIVPLFDKGERKCVNNYRGVCPMS